MPTLYPAKFEWDFSKPIFKSNANYEIVDGLMRGICEVYFDRSGSPELAIVVLNASEIDVLKQELQGGLDGALNEVMKAMIDYAEHNQPINGQYCFVAADF